MQCDICFRTGDLKLPFLCPTDARNQLYEPRLKHARVLLEKAALDKDISEITSRNTSADAIDQASKNLSNHSSRWDIDRAVNERESTIDRTKQIIAQAEDLRANIAAARDDIERRKALLKRRKSELASAKNGTEARRAKQLEEIDRKTKMTTYRWNQMHVMTAQSRAFLCGEAAKLYGLQRLRDHGVWLNEYSIAGIKIIDLRAMNSASAAQITTSLSYIAHLLVLATHYLAIRLPAEITLPHRDYPLPTILSLSSSHTSTNLPFPGSTPVQSSSNSPSASKHAEVNNMPRPRPLFLRKPLPLLAAEDPSAYALFIEGTTLLAYDIAWVCKSQGISVGSSTPTSFEDLCDIGRNLFNLLIGSSPRPSPPSRLSSAQSTPTKSKYSRDQENSSEDPKQLNAGITSIGQFSHGTAHTSLNSPFGQEFVRTFKLLSPVKLADELKKRLHNEVASAEWEVVDQNAWTEDLNEEYEGDDDGVVIGAQRLSGDGGHQRTGSTGAGRWGGGLAQSFMSMRTVMDAVELVGGGIGNADAERKPGTSGWTKLKPR